MAARNRANGTDSFAVNGTERQQRDLFQNLEKLIASAVSICRLDGSVQCQIGGLITVIEELQRLLRHSFTEIKRLERNVEDQRRNLEDQEHTFANNVSNLHYQVKEVQSSVETLKRETEEAQKSKEISSANQQNSSNQTSTEPLHISLVDESYGEESDGSIPTNFQVENTSTETGDDPLIPNNLVDSTLTETEDNPLIPNNLVIPNNFVDSTLAETGDKPLIPNNLVENTLTETGEDPFVGLSQTSEDSTTPADLGKEDGVEDNTEETTERVTTPPRETTNASNSLLETATSTTEERESALRSLRSTSSKADTSSSQEHGRNNRLKSRARSLEIEAGLNRSILSLRKSSHHRSPLVTTNSKTQSPKSSPQNAIRKGTPPKASLSKQILKKNAAQHKKTPPNKPPRKIQPSPQKQNTPKRTGKSLSPSKLKRLKSPVKTPQKQRELTKLQKKGQASVKQSRKSLGVGFKKNSKVVSKSPKTFSPLKTRNGARLSISPFKRNQVSNTKASKANESLSKESKEPKTASTVPILSEENPMDKYINLDFLLNANQLMSELVSDTDREQGTLDTASDVERRYIVDLAKLYRLRVRMADKCDGDLPVALIKGRESSLPKAGQVDRLLYTMTHAMAIKTKSAANKHKLSGSRRSLASLAKKRRI